MIYINNLVSIIFENTTHRNHIFMFHLSRDFGFQPPTEFSLQALKIYAVLNNSYNTLSSVTTIFLTPEIYKMFSDDCMWTEEI